MESPNPPERTKGQKQSNLNLAGGNFMGFHLNAPTDNNSE